MTREQKDLLIKDLSARLPYGVIVKDRNGIHELTPGNTEFTDLFNNNKCNIKPYLRPISSMTEKEVTKLFDILNLDKENETEWLKVNDSNIIRLFTQEGKDFYEIAEAIDYLYSIHVDFRGLLWENLAIEAPEDMYNIKPNFD